MENLKLRLLKTNFLYLNSYLGKGFFIPFCITSKTIGFQVVTKQAMFLIAKTFPTVTWLGRVAPHTPL
jgi:hypothetical protein